MAHNPKQQKTWIGQPTSLDQIAPPKHETSTSLLGAALLQLPQQYFRAVVKPSVATYIQDKGKASWRLVWIQLLAWAILDAALGFVVNLCSPPATGSSFARFF